MSARLRELAVSALLLAAACGPSERTGPPRAGSPLPDLQLATLEGTPVSLADLKGSPVLVNLWATWCFPCREETPFLQSVYETHRASGLEVVGVSVDDAGSLEAVHAFMQEKGVTYKVLHDPRMASLDVFAVIGLPATLLVDREGVIRYYRAGPVSEKTQDFMTALREVTAPGEPAGE